MKRKLLTDIELRANWSRNPSDAYCVEENTLLTPAAQDFIRDHRIQLRYCAPSGEGDTMTVTPIPTKNGHTQYRDTDTGAALEHKPEDMTHLRGNLLVPKTHPRIELRGRLDSLMAKIIEVEVMAEAAGEADLLQELEELLGFTRRLLACEVKDEPLRDIRLLGLDSEAVREHSHQVKRYYGIDHPVPSYKMGALCAALNGLRTRAREAELSACRAFTRNGTVVRGDLIEGLNRLSSCVYIIFCRKLSGHYDKGGRP